MESQDTRLEVILKITVLNRDLEWEAQLKTNDTEKKVTPEILSLVLYSVVGWAQSNVFKIEFMILFK